MTTPQTAPLLVMESETRSMSNLLSALRDALTNEGLLITAEVDLQALMQERLDKDISGYRILSVCQLESAYEAVLGESDAGSLLTCDIAVYEPAPGNLMISSEIPMALDKMGHPALAAYRLGLKRAIERALANLD